jgi:Cft2 family RNA processing exonuclease
MFHYADGLKLTGIDLAIDFRRRQPRGFISHAHADHMARHDTAFCTPETAALYQHRYGQRRVIHWPYRKPFPWGDTRLTTFPAGHVLGSAMLLAEAHGRRLLYTGDFKLRPSSTAEIAAPPPADILVMESTFGKPQYRLPPREQTIERLLRLIDESLQHDRTPVIYAYALGKAQEVTKILTEHQIAVAQHPEIYAVSKVYQQCRCDLGPIQCYEGRLESRCALIVPPRGQRSGYVPLPARHTTISVTGWAMDRGARFRYGVDHALPLSDHADFDELIACVERVGPEVVYCTHGPVEFVASLRDLGYNAYPLGQESQLRLF